MATDAELMLMAMGSYARLPLNTAPIPQGWEIIPLPPPNSSSGFSAAAFRNLTTGEVVIAYAGTDSDTLGLLAADFVNGNIPAAAGLYAPQVWEAIKFYSDVRAFLNLPENQDANIKLTGHSLGGGLASVVGTYFLITHVAQPVSQGW